MTVLSAVEGLNVATPAFEKFVVPISVGILFGLFFIQKHGTGTVAKFSARQWWRGFVLAALGIFQIVENPGILKALNPWYSWHLIHYKVQGWLVLGAVVLCVTGGEALYADMGHFGKSRFAPVGSRWCGLRCCLTTSARALCCWSNRRRSRIRFS